MDASYRLFKKKKEQSTIKTNRNKAEGPRVLPRPIVGEASLPHEIIIKIFEYLGPVNVFKVSRTCRFWHETSNDAGLWRDFCRLAIYKSLVDNYEDGTFGPKEAIYQRFCEKQMKLLTRVKESAASATSSNFWKEKYLTMLIDDIRALYSCKEAIQRVTNGPAKAWKNIGEIVTFHPDGKATEEELFPETIYKVVALVNTNKQASELSGIFQTTDGYYLLISYAEQQMVKHWDLEILLRRFTGPYMREMWHLPTLHEFGKFWSSSAILSRCMPAELRWYLIKAGLKLIKSCDTCYNNSRYKKSKPILGGIAATGSLADESGLSDLPDFCEVCSGTGDVWLFEAIDPPSSTTESNKKIDREVYSAHQVLLRISTQWRKHKEQMIDRHISAVLEKSKQIQEEQKNADEARQERKRKFDELVFDYDNIFEYDTVAHSAKKFKLLESSEEIENLQTSGGWNTWLAKKGYAGIENFALRLKNHRPLPYLADVLYPTDIKSSPFENSEWTLSDTLQASFMLIFNNEFFAPHQLEYDNVPQYVAQHQILPRASMCSSGVRNLALWKRTVLLGHTGLHMNIYCTDHYN